MKVSNFIICDDIRIEMGNKHSLMGVYSDSINFHSVLNQKAQWPKIKSLAVFAQIEFEREEKISNIHQFSIEIDYEGEVKDIGGGPLPPTKETDKKGILINAIFNNFQFKGPGNIKFYFKFYDKDKKLIDTAESHSALRVEETISNKAR
ncbi:MAG: hypothetical protein KKD21_00675 [Proteobacteria bacterium]|nr:hypothetical protein [Pseudomonadota bacterium]MBU1695544.1 hypothetical protein [Pseudomonadota bacterium]